VRATTATAASIPVLRQMRDVGADIDEVTAAPDETVLKPLAVIVVASPEII
jgi:hypothetical protein